MRFSANHSADNVPDHWWSLSSHTHLATSYLCEAAAAIWEGLSPCGWLVCSWIGTSYPVPPNFTHWAALKLCTALENFYILVCVLVLKSQIPSKGHPHFDITYLVMQQRALSVFKKGAALKFWPFDCAGIFGSKLHLLQPSSVRCLMNKL